MVLPMAAMAQGAQVAFGGLKHDSSLPVEIAADQLKIDQNTGLATFTGNVLIGQGTLRLGAGSVVVEYTTQGGDVQNMRASGGVTFSNGAEAAEAQSAVYAPGSGQMVLSGEVVLTQGNNALAGERLVINLSDGTGTMEGRVRTIFQTGNN
ncbi:lipopolysaccharide transport periplasmic protein LptA [Harenicola maris]